MNKVIRIGTRESQLALWQANEVKSLLEKSGFSTELVLIKSEGDINLTTPLYELGVQGIFTKTLDAALISNSIDVAVHSMKDVPTQLAKGLTQAAVLPRASHKDLFVPKNDAAFMNDSSAVATVATSSIRRKAQWLNRFPLHKIDSLRGNVNTRLQKVQESEWQGAIFAAAGLERINLRPSNAVELDWMLPAPAQGAIVIACREDDSYVKEACDPLNDIHTDICTRIEREFLRQLMGGCSMPISALAQIKNEIVYFEGNILSPDGRHKAEVRKEVHVANSEMLGIGAANDLLENGGKSILDALKSEGK